MNDARRDQGKLTRVVAVSNLDTWQNSSQKSKWAKREFGAIPTDGGCFSKRVTAAERKNKKSWRRQTSRTILNTLYYFISSCNSCDDTKHICFSFSRSVASASRSQTVQSADEWCFFLPYRWNWPSGTNSDETKGKLSHIRGIYNLVIGYQFGFRVRSIHTNIIVSPNPLISVPSFFKTSWS